MMGNGWRTVTVFSSVTVVPSNPSHVMVYVVVRVGDTTLFPLLMLSVQPYVGVIGMSVRSPIIGIPIIDGYTPVVITGPTKLLSTGTDTVGISANVVLFRVPVQLETFSDDHSRVDEFPRSMVSGVGKGLGSRVWGLGSRICGRGSRDGLGCRVKGPESGFFGVRLWSKVSLWGLRSRAYRLRSRGLGSPVSGQGSKV